ncbi:DinB family protein [Solicola sp. PLA-1-18]|uniref:DinB family protein n=1 Tax=Solicola sp. PLA-1-18 TaxID=3380532 RepID=UPI003B82C1B1
MAWTDDLRARHEELLEEYRTSLRGQLDGLTEEEARRSLVPSRTTLLGLVKHVTYVERFYFDHLVTGRSLKEIGVASTPDRSFVLRKTDTIETVLAAHAETCDASRRTLADLAFGDVVDGARGERTVWALVLQVVRELAHHSGHADILREQVLAARDDD